MGLCAECFLLLEDTQKSLGLESFEPVCHYETINVVLVVVETGGEECVLQLGVLI